MGVLTPVEGFTTLFTTEGGARYRICAMTDPANAMACTIRIEPEDAAPVPAPAPATQALARHAGLTQREAQVAALIAEGCTNAEIADELFISLSTVKSHVQSIFGKFHVQNRAMLVKCLLDTAA